MDAFISTTRYDHALLWEHPLRVQLMHNHVVASPKLRPDMHYALHMGLVLKGAMAISYPDCSMHVGPGQAWFTACWEPHVGNALEDTTILLFTVLLEALGHVAPFANVPWEAPFLCPAPDRPQIVSRQHRQEITRNGQRIVADPEDGDADTEILNWLCFHELLLPFVRAIHEGPPTHASSLARVKPALELVRKTHRVVDVDEAAETCGLGRRRFCTLFRQSFGVSFGRFALRARLSGAATDLRGTDEPIKQIAAKWGFHDSSHFHRSFSADFGMTPSAFRRENR